MAYQPDPDNYDIEEMRRVALQFYEKGKTIKEIADDLIIPRAKVAAMCTAAQKAGIVRIVVEPSPRLANERLRYLAEEVRKKFGLLDCIIVNGRKELLDQRLHLDDRFKDAHAVIVDDMTGRAAEQFVFRFRHEPTPCVAITYGLIVRKIVNNITLLKPDKNVEALFLAAQGIRRLDQDRFDTSDLVRDFARDFGCNYAVMPIPALVESVHVKVFEDSYLVQEILEKLNTKTNIVLSSLGPLAGTYTGTIQPSLHTELIPPGGLQFVRDHGAIGNVGGWWFDSEGSHVPYEHHTVIGLGLDKMRSLVEAALPVILAVGGDPLRIPALAVALSCNKPLANIWIGDEVTARVLLGEMELSRTIGDHTFTDLEWAAIQSAIDHSPPVPRPKHSA